MLKKKRKTYSKWKLTSDITNFNTANAAAAADSKHTYTFISKMNKVLWMQNKTNQRNKKYNNFQFIKKRFSGFLLSLQYVQIFGFTPTLYERGGILTNKLIRKIWFQYKLLMILYR